MTFIKTACSALLALGLIMALASPADAGGPRPEIDNWYFVDRSFGQLYPDDGMVLYTLGEATPSDYAIGVDVTNTGSVKFFVDGQEVRIENEAPYYLAGDVAGVWTPIDLGPGTYKLTAIPYSEDNAEGHWGGASSVKLTIVDGYPRNRSLIPEDMEPSAGVDPSKLDPPKVPFSLFG